MGKFRDWLIGKDADTYYNKCNHSMDPLTDLSDDERFSHRHVWPIYYRYFAWISFWMSGWDFKFYMRYQDRRRVGTGSLFNPRRNIAGEYPLFKRMVDLRMMQAETIEMAVRAPWVGYPPS